MAFWSICQDGNARECDSDRTEYSAAINESVTFKIMRCDIQV